MRIKTLIILTAAYFVYLLIGAAIFHSLERQLEIQRCNDAESYRKSIFNETLSQNISMDDVAKILPKLFEFNRHGIRIRRNEVTCPINWDFQSSVFFSGTIVTTIGYGHITPTTDSSRAVVAIYALFGIPLCAIMFGGLGDLFSHLIGRLGTHIDKKDLKPWVRNLTIVSLFVAIGFTLFCCIPAAIFSAVEQWPFKISMYYAIITLTTIGFGDYVAGNNPDIEYVPMYRVMVYFWILFGLAFMATFINVISERAKKQATKAKKKCKIRNGTLRSRRETTEVDGDDMIALENDEIVSVKETDTIDDN